MRCCCVVCILDDLFLVRTRGVYMSFRPWLYLPAGLSHKLGPIGLSALGLFRTYQKIEYRPLSWRGLKFSNPIGLAAGADKNARNVRDWWAFGVGFVEVGTVTLAAQKGNPGKVIDRVNHERAVWNKLGFPSEGSDAVLTRLNKLPSPRFTPVFVNIGKNKATPNENAATEYRELARKMSPAADAIVVNISSPNTKGLRDLQNAKFISEIILAAREGAASNRILLKLSPDMEMKDLETALNVSLDCGVDGWILTNTTTSRPAGLNLPVEGGLSGQPLCERSRQVLQFTMKTLGSRRGDRLVVSCGGISNAEEARLRLDMGADLVQIYSALIFDGPLLVKDWLSSLSLSPSSPS